MDKIILEDIEYYGYHGVAEEEKILGQKFIVSLEIGMDFTEAAREDNLDKTINYSTVCAEIEEVFQSTKFDLIETAAMEMVKIIFDRHRAAQYVKVLLKKPYAPLKRHLKYAAVEIERRRDEFYGGR